MRLSRRLDEWMRSVGLPTATTPDAARADFVARTMAFAEAHGIADEEALRSLARLRLRPNFPELPTSEQQAVLSRTGFSDTQRVAALGRLLSAHSKLRRVTLDMNFTAERQRRD